MKENIIEELKKSPLELTCGCVSLLVAIWSLALSVALSVLIAYFIYTSERELTIEGLPTDVDVHKNEPEIYTWAVCDINNDFVYGINAAVLAENYGTRPAELRDIEVEFSDELWKPELVVDSKPVTLPILLTKSEGVVKWHITASRTYTEPTRAIVDSVNARQGQLVQITLQFNNQREVVDKRFSADFTDIYDPKSCYLP